MSLARRLSTQVRSLHKFPSFDRHHSKPRIFLAIKLPDLSRPHQNPPVQIPHVPGFWNSARPSTVAPLEPELPKLHVVGGSATHYDGGPTYNLEKHREDDPLSTTVREHTPPASSDPGFRADFWESLGFPRSFRVHDTLSNLRPRHDKAQTRSRPLTDDEKKGLYILLGVLGGSWFVGWLVNRPSGVAEEQPLDHSLEL